MIDYNPRETRDIPKIGIPTIGIGKTAMMNVFGVTDRAYIIEETKEPYLLWEDGSPMAWEDKSKILLEQQLVRIWLRKGRKSAR